MNSRLALNLEMQRVSNPEKAKRLNEAAIKKIYRRSGSTQIRHLIKRLGLTQVQFADLLCTSPQQLLLYVNGKISPSPKVAKRMQRIAREFGVEITLDEIYSDVEDNYSIEDAMNRVMKSMNLLGE